MAKDEIKYPKIAEWMNEKHLEFSRNERRVTTIAEFAEFLGLEDEYESVRKWLAGATRPTGRSLRVLGLKLGLEIYDLVGEERPDPLWLIVEEAWPGATHDAKEAAVQAVTRPKGRADVEDSTKRVAKPKRK